MTVVAAIDCGTNTIKLMVADLPAGADRSSGRPGWSGSARTSTAPAGSPTRRWSGTFAAVDEYAAMIGAAPRRADPVLRHLGHP